MITKKITLLTATLLLSAGVLYAQPDASRNVNEEKRTEWRFFKNGNAKTDGDFVASGVMHSFCGTPSDIRFVGKGKKGERKGGKNAGAENGYEYSLKSGMPTVKGCKAGDAWVFEMPVENLAAGSVVDFWTAFSTEADRTAHKYLLEYCDGGKWRPASATTAQDKVIYNCTSTTKPKIPRYVWSAVHLSKPVKRGKISFRLTQADKSESTTTLYGGATGQSPRIICYEAVEPRDTLRILFLGNSYTYYNLYPVIFKEMAWREGHYADCTMFVSGGYTMKAHLSNPVSCETVARGGYDYAMIQDQSVTPLMNDTEEDFGQRDYLVKMVESVRRTSPAVKPILEITWGRKFGNNSLGKYKHLSEKYPQYFADYDAMQKRLIEQLTYSASVAGTDISKVGCAWQYVRHDRPDIELYAKDSHHPSYAGSYLSAAVAYLTIYGTPFGDNPANGKLDADTAAYLRDVATKIVLGQ